MTDLGSLYTYIITESRRQKKDKDRCDSHDEQQATGLTDLPRQGVHNLLAPSAVVFQIVLAVIFLYLLLRSRETVGLRRTRLSHNIRIELKLTW